jgi:hypothetical protein
MREVVAALHADQAEALIELDELALAIELVLRAAQQVARVARQSQVDVQAMALVERLDRGTAEVLSRDTRQVLDAAEVLADALKEVRWQLNSWAVAGGPQRVRRDSN